MPQIHAALATQASRKEPAVAEEKQRKAAATAEASHKRSTPLRDIPDPKRVKLGHESTPTPAPAFDFASLPATLVTDLIIANLQAFTETTLVGLVQAYKQKRAGESALAADNTPPVASTSAAAIATPPPTAPRSTVPPSEPRADRKGKSPSPPPPTVVKEEPVDPLKMDIDEEELEYEADRLTSRYWRSRNVSDID